MNKFKAWLQDKKNLPIVAGACAMILIGVVFLYLKQFGIIGGSAPTTEPGATPVTPTAQAPQPQSPATAPAEPPPPSMPAPSATPSAPPGAAAPAQVAPETVQAPMLPYRKDPFMAFTGLPTRTQALMNLVPTVSRIRIAPASVRIRRLPGAELLSATEQILPPQPFRRVAGILWDGGSVKAILETEGQVEIVKPGDNSQYSRVRVESIQPDSVILKTLDTPTPMTIKVNLAGSLAAEQGGAEIAPTGYPEGPPPGAVGATGEGPPPGF